MIQGIPTLYDINIPGIRKLYQNQRSLLDFINFNKPSKSLEESFEEYDVELNDILGNIRNDFKSLGSTYVDNRMDNIYKNNLLEQAFK